MLLVTEDYYLIHYFMGTVIIHPFSFFSLISWKTFIKINFLSWIICLSVLKTRISFFIFLPQTWLIVFLIICVFVCEFMNLIIFDVFLFQSTLLLISKSPNFWWVERSPCRLASVVSEIYIYIYFTSFFSSHGKIFQAHCDHLPTQPRN